MVISGGSVRKTSIRLWRVYRGSKKLLASEKLTMSPKHQLILMKTPRSREHSEQRPTELYNAYENTMALLELCRERSLGDRRKCSQCSLKSFCAPQWLWTINKLSAIGILCANALVTYDLSICRPAPDLDRSNHQGQLVRL